MKKVINIIKEKIIFISQLKYNNITTNKNIKFIKDIMAFENYLISI
jgi:hypothetical protein